MTRQKRRRTAIRATLAGAAISAATTTAGAGADIDLGRYLASECLTCHRAQTAASSIPNLAAMPQAHFIAAIKAYRQKELANPAMQNVAARLSDDDIESLALYFSTSKQP